MFMETKPAIDFQGMAPLPSIQADVVRHVAQLEARFGRITACRVVIKGPGPHHRNGGPYEIHIHLTLPNSKDVSVAHTAQNDERYADINFALNDAFKRARRQLQDRVKRLRRDVKHHEPAPAGKVARIDASGEFGFIETPDGREVYFHRNSVLNDAFGRLEAGTPVAYAEEDGEKGPQATTVRPLGKHLV
jgi:cold shock CspA family protein/ribosome-associated translation inhibitor RaiA